MFIRLRADGFRRARIVARDHDDTDAHVAQLADGLRAVGLEPFLPTSSPDGTALVTSAAEQANSSHALSNK